MAKESKAVDVPVYVTEFVEAMYRKYGETDGRYVIHYAITREDPDVGFCQTGDSGQCLYDPQFNHYLDWIRGVHTSFTSKGMFVEWNVFQKQLTPEQLGELETLNTEIQKSLEN